MLKPLTNSNESLHTIQNKFTALSESQHIVNGFIQNGSRQEKVPNWKIFKRWEYYWEQRVNPQTGEFPATTSAAEYQDYIAKHQKKATENFTSNWFNLGTNTSAGGYAGIGRINCIAFHPTDNQTFWAGSPSGGLWKTTNGGTSWAVMNDHLPVIGVSNIALPADYTTSHTMYIATGDRDGGSLWTLSGGQVADNPSVGVLKSTDDGQTWQATGLTYTASQSRMVYRLLTHPTNSQVLFAATTNGIYKSTDAGATWVQKNSNRFIDMEFKPGDPTIMYASTAVYGSTYVFRSTNSGESWVTTATIATGRRGEMAVSAADPSVVYLLVATTTGGPLGVFKSTNSGASFAQVNTNTTQNMMGYYTDGHDAISGQGSYDWCIAASPADANTVFIGGITTWKSTDGGITWTANTNWTASSYYNISGVPVVHADKHALEFQNSSTLFEGNDGGIYKTTNGGASWTDITNGMVMSQIYRIGVSKTDITKILAGLQDNGSKKYNGAVNTWSDVHGGDGMECIIDNNNATSYMYVTYVDGMIYRTDNAFGNSVQVQISNNIPGGQPDGAWVAPYIMDVQNSAVLYAGYDKVWKTTDRGNTWTSASQVLSSSAKLRTLAIAPSNSSVLYAADQTHLWKTTDGGATDWAPVTLPSTSASVTYLTVKDTDPNTLWITYGGYTNNLKVYQTTDGGATWTNISAGLPNLPVMSLAYNKRVTDKSVLFAATDVGVYIKDGSADWEPFSNGLPNVVVSELEMFYGSTTTRLVAGTFGRGLWATDIISTTPVVGTPELTSPANSSSNNSLHPLLQWSTVAGTSGYQVQLATDSLFTGVLIDSVITDTAYSVTVKLANATRYYWRVKATGGSFSGIFSFTTWTGFTVYLNNPVGHATVYTLTPTLTWNITTGATNILYDVLITPDSLFGSAHTSVLSANTSTSLIVPALQPATKYYWKVRAKNAQGSVMAYSVTEDFTTFGNLVTPTPTWPSGGTTVYTLNPALYWYTGVSSYAYTYQVRYKSAADVAWSAPIATGGSLSMQLADLAAGTTYYWQVRAYNGTAYSNWSADQIFATFGAVASPAPVPTLSYPVGGVTVYATAPMLYWYIGASSAGVDYSVIISKNRDFSSPAVDVSDLAQLYYQASGLEPGTVYYWKVRSHNGSGYSNWSAADSFYTYNLTGNLQPVLTYPVTGCVVYTQTPTLYWYTLGGAAGTQYELQYAKTVAGFAAQVITANTWYTLPALEYGEKYFWRVRSRQGSTVSGWSAVDSFEVTGKAGSLIPIVTWPIGGALSSTEPTVYWYVNSYVSGMTFSVEYADNAAFTNAVTVTTANFSSQITGLSSGSTYYWRVRAYNGSAYSPYSSVAQFVTTGGSAPGRPVCGSPANGVAITTNTPVLSWFRHDATGSVEYELQYANLPDFSDAVTVQNLHRATYVPEGITYAKPVYWRVRAKSTNGIYSNYSETGHFIAVQANAVEDTRIVPADFGLYQNYPNPFNPVTTIRFDIPQEGLVKLAVYSQLGTLVAELVNQQLPGGSHSIHWNAAGYPSGVYYYELRAGNFRSVKKLILLK